MRAARAGKVVLLLLAVLVFGAAAAVTLWARARRHLAEEALARSRASFADHRDEFMRDQARLSRLPLLAARPGGDAGPVIGPRIRWVLGTPGGLRWKQAEGRAPDFDAIQGRGDGLRAPPERWRGLDFGWMGQLRGLRAWDVGHGGMADDLASFTGPEPQSADLATWAELRIAKGIREGAVSAALAEVEELARLCLTTERWELYLVGFDLLELVDGVQETVPAAAGHAPAATREDLAVMRRAAGAALGFARLETPAGYDEDLGRFALGTCVALHDGAWLAYALRPALGEAWSANYARIGRLLDAHPECPLRTLRARWARPPRAMAPARLLVVRTGPHPLPVPTPLVDGLRWLPAVRRANAEMLLASGAEDWFVAYDQPGPAR